LLFPPYKHPHIPLLGPRPLEFFPFPFFLNIFFSPLFSTALVQVKCGSPHLSGAFFCPLGSFTCHHSFFFVLCSQHPTTSVFLWKQSFVSSSPRWTTPLHRLLTSHRVSLFLIFLFPIKPFPLWLFFLLHFFSFSPL